ncbi:carboxypeptidase-like regulatory domain-containing protein [Chryseolinea sp. T2]|uniref:carboxypeptidase-like regulatory domain-containing protein n=1 Tax=Chryseolinea sp. T2 TaxID=3129255 RepID=UPI003076C787
MLLLLALRVGAQESYITVRGRLIDEANKEPIPYASIQVLGGSTSTTSNDDGRFIFHVPTAFGDRKIRVSALGYDHYEATAASMTTGDLTISLKPGVTVLSEVTINAKKELTAKEIVKTAVSKIPSNYPMKPFVIEGFFRDMQKENDKPVELLEAALRFNYKDYNPGYEGVEILEVRRSINKRHPINGTYDRQNSIIDLMEDNYVKQRFGPIQMKGWKFNTDSVLTYNSRTVYKISGSKGESASTEMFIDSETFAILKLEFKNQMVDGQYYRRYLNLPDPYGLQETSFRMVFEFQQIDHLMYLKYQREEDTYNLFNKTTQEILLRQAFVKELFVNNVIVDPGSMITSKSMNFNKSVEGQAPPYNEEFWKYYNAPLETLKESKIIEELAGTSLLQK